MRRYYLVLHRVRKRSVVNQLFVSKCTFVDIGKTVRQCAHTVVARAVGHKHTAVRCGVRLQKVVHIGCHVVKIVETLFFFGSQALPIGKSSDKILRIVLRLVDKLAASHQLVTCFDRQIGKLLVDGTCAHNYVCKQLCLCCGVVGRRRLTKVCVKVFHAVARKIQ